MSITTSPFIRPLGMSHNPQAAAQLVDRVFAEGRTDQFKRELVVNSLQAGATKIEITAVRPGEDDGFKAAFVDNGIGMASTKIGDYIGELFAGASTLGPDRNFQMGARVSTLPWNHAGVIVASWTEGEPEGTMIHLAYDDETETYRVHGFDDPDDPDAPTTSTGVPLPWMKHPIIDPEKGGAGHGTVVILLGNHPADNTVADFTRVSDGGFAFPEHLCTDGRAGWNYYNEKFWDLINCNGEPVDVQFLWMNRDFRVWRALVPVREWPKSGRELADEECPGCERPQYHGQGHGRDGQGLRHKIQLRRVRGLKNIIDRYAAEKWPEDERIQHGSVHVRANGHGATVHWALTPPRLARGSNKVDYSEQGDFGVRIGLFAERMGDELYAIKTGPADTRVIMEYYGIIDPELRNRTIILVEPDPRPGPHSYGAVPSSARDRLMIANGELPHREWGAEFGKVLPQPIRDRIDLLLGSGSPSDPKRQAEAAARMNRLFGRRPSRKADPDGQPTSTQDSVYGDPNRTNGTRPKPERQTSSTTRSPYGHRPNPAVTPDATSTSTSGTRGGRPKGTITTLWDDGSKGLFDKRPGVMAHFVEASRVLEINGAHAVLRGIVHDIADVRPGRKAQIEGIAQAAVTAFYEDYINAVEMFPSSFANRGLPDTDAAHFTRDALTDNVLTAVGVNVEMIERLIVGKFRGYPGLKPVRPTKRVADEVRDLEAEVDDDDLTHLVEVRPS